MKNSSFSNQPLGQASGQLSERAEIERELEAGEKLLWSGSPAPGSQKRADWSRWGGHVFGVLFSLLWMGLVSQNLVKDFQAGRPIGIFDLLFPALGLFFLGGVFIDLLRERERAARAFYGVTDRRALIVFVGKTREVRSFLPHQIQLGRRERDGNLGDILLNDARVLAQEKPPTSFRLHTPQKSEEQLEREVAFLSIENPRRVEDIIRQKLLGRIS